VTRESPEPATIHDVSIVIPARNAAHTLDQVLTDLAHAVPGTTPVIVVDDGSTDDTGAVASSHRDQLPALQVIRGEGRGPAAARNAGANAATSTWIAFTDADVRVPPDWFEEGCARLAADVDVVEGIVTPHGGADRGLVRKSAFTDANRRYVTANLWIRKSALERAGGFDETFPAPWREDTVFGLRLEDTAARVVSALDCRIEHPYYRGRIRDLFRWSAKVDSDTLFFKKFGARSRHVMPTRGLKRSYATLAYIGVAGVASAVTRSVVVGIALVIGTFGLATWAAWRFLEYPAPTSVGERAAFVLVSPAIVLWRVITTVRSNLRYRTRFF
jgi:glycosyltransferase involved in cell wall biosynthesis